MNSTKHALYQACVASLNERIQVIEQSIQQIQASANEETKSSAGDKYETGRAMAQLEIEKMSLQLAELRKASQELTRISPNQKHTQVKHGSLIFTDRGNFYIAVNAGQFTIHNTDFYSISPNAPLALSAMGLAANASFIVQGKKFTLTDIQ
jgi:hypothetical protein